jgi:hypothetical protein
MLSPAVIRFPDIGGATLEKVIQYLHYKAKYSNSTTRIPEFQIEPDEVSVAQLHVKVPCGWTLFSLHELQSNIILQLPGQHNN